MNSCAREINPIFAALQPKLSMQCEDSITGMFRNDYKWRKMRGIDAEPDAAWGKAALDVDVRRGTAEQVAQSSFQTRFVTRARLQPGR